MPFKIYTYEDPYKLDMACATTAVMLASVMLSSTEMKQPSLMHC